MPSPETTQPDPVIERADPDPKPVYQNEWLRVYFDQVRFPDGSPGRYNRIEEGKTGYGVAVLPVTEQGSVILVGQYRYPVSSVQWEIPRGFADATDLESEARRELGEEFCLNKTVTDKLTLLRLGSVFANTSLLATPIHIYLAQSVPEPAGRSTSENGAILGTRLLDRSTLEGEIASGKVCDSITLAALHLARIRYPKLAP